MKKQTTIKAWAILLTGFRKSADNFLLDENGQYLIFYSKKEAKKENESMDEVIIRTYSV